MIATPHSQRENKLKRTPEERAALLAHLRENYVYEPEGRIRHKARDRPIRGKNMKPTYRNPHPYLRVNFRAGGIMQEILYHQAVWFICKGRWPEGQIDHINGNPRDNRIENLRECNQSENTLNTLLPWKPNAVTGVPGVSPNKSMFQCYIRGKNFHFHNPYEAFYWAVMCGKKYK